TSNDASKILAGCELQPAGCAPGERPSLPEIRLALGRASDGVLSRSPRRVPGNLNQSVRSPKTTVARWEGATGQTCGECGQRDWAPRAGLGGAVRSGAVNRRRAGLERSCRRLAVAEAAGGARPCSARGESATRDNKPGKVGACVEGRWCLSSGGKVPRHHPAS